MRSLKCLHTFPDATSYFFLRLLLLDDITHWVGNTTLGAWGKPHTALKRNTLCNLPTIQTGGRAQSGKTEPDFRIWSRAKIFYAKLKSITNAVHQNPKRISGSIKAHIL